jgi:ketosteroid isomerase-like protein
MTMADSLDDPEETIVRRAIEALGALDIDTVLALLADDVVLELPFRADGGPVTMRGNDARRFIAAMPKLFSSLDLVDIVVHGRMRSGQIVAEYRSEGTTRSGRPYPNRYVAFFRVGDGVITEWREYFDPNVIATAFAP